jgi:hypothetical protein
VLVREPITITEIPTPQTASETVKSVFPTFGRVCDSLLLVGVIGGRNPGWAG